MTKPCDSPKLFLVRSARQHAEAGGMCRGSSAIAFCRNYFSALRDLRYSLHGLHRLNIWRNESSSPQNRAVWPGVMAEALRQANTLK